MGKFHLYSCIACLVYRITSYNVCYTKLLRIRRAQTVVFNLAELKELVAIKAKSNKFPIEVANELIAKKREKLRNDVNEIMSLDRRLTELEDELKRNFG